MNKKIKLIVVSLILLVIVGINISYAISIPDTSSFFEVNKKELASGETLEMIMDLSQINYEQFELVLSSNVEIEKVYADSDITFNQGSNDVVIDIDKAKLNLNKIVLYYQIPENVELGTKLQLKAQAIIIENDEEKVVNKKQVEITIVEKENEDNKNQEDNKNEGNEKEENKNEDKKNEDNKNQEDSKNEGNEKEENKNEDKKNEEIKSPEQNVNKELQGNPSNETASKNLNQNSMQKQHSNTNKSSSTTSNLQNMNHNSGNAKTSATPTETATYNGSNNNYLSSLEIDGVQLTSDFNKEKSTYFATVEGLETITVTANAENASSKVAITGTNLKSGENKVLISVTAENGDVRYYRIYVTKI